MKHNKKMRLATAPHRTMTATERFLWADCTIRLDLPAAFTVPTKDGGSLKFAWEGDQISFLYTGATAYYFAMRFPSEVFLAMLCEGGSHNCPNAGVLTASPLSGSQMKLSLDPDPHASGPWQGLSFEADFSRDALMASLYPTGA